MNKIVFIFASFILIILIRALFNFVNLFSNISWLYKNQPKKKFIRNTYDNFIICIPMLREQKILPDTIKYFSRLNYPKDNYQVIIVTTSKEKKELNKLTTFELASKITKKINYKLGIKLFRIINYPRKKGVMSHQINYVIRKFIKNKKNEKNIFAIYNADSRPNLNTLKNISLEFSKYKKQTNKNPNIIQQSSLFTLNYESLPKNLTGYIMKAAALFQTKWTLTHELSRLRKQSITINYKTDNLLLKIFNTNLSHCVGHGLFVRLDLLAKEYLPTETINEDLPFGFYQCCKKEPILPFPVLENSDVPLSLKSLINQKKVWFYPYLEYQKCRNRVVKLKKYHSLFEVNWLTIQGQFTGFIWLFQSLILFLPIFIAICLKSNILVLTWFLTITIYWFLPVAIIYYLLPSLEKIAGEKKTQLSVIDYFLTSLAGILILFTHSIGPILSIYNFGKAKYLHRPIIKTKTER